MDILVLYDHRHTIADKIKFIKLDPIINLRKKKWKIKKWIKIFLSNKGI